MNKDIFLIDFDGTIAFNDTTKCLAENLIPDMHSEYVSRFRAGTVNVRQFVYDLLTSLNVTECQFVSTIQKYIKVDHTFKSFLDMDYEFCILSAGTKLNVSSALQTIDIYLDDSKMLANNIHFTNDKIDITYPYYCEENGMNKAFIVRKFKQEGYRVIFVGDGPSDYEACKYADIVFARTETRLVNKLKLLDMEFTDFADFNELLEKYITLKQD